MPRPRVLRKTFERRSPLGRTGVEIAADLALHARSSPRAAMGKARPRRDRPGCGSDQGVERKRLAAPIRSSPRSVAYRIVARTGQVRRLDRHPRPTRTHGRQGRRAKDHPSPPHALCSKSAVGPTPRSFYLGAGHSLRPKGCLHLPERQPLDGRRPHDTPEAAYHRRASRQPCTVVSHPLLLASISYRRCRPRSVGPVDAPHAGCARRRCGAPSATTAPSSPPRYLLPARIAGTRGPRHRRDARMPSSRRRALLDPDAADSAALKGAGRHDGPARCAAWRTSIFWAPTPRSEISPLPPWYPRLRALGSGIVWLIVCPGRSAVGPARAGTYDLAFGPALRAFAEQRTRPSTRHRPARAAPADRRPRRG